jgi:hypothetical protein
MDALSELGASVRARCVWKLESTGWTSLFFGKAIASFCEFSYARHGIDMEDHGIYLRKCGVDNRCHSMDLTVIGSEIR